MAWGTLALTQRVATNNTTIPQFADDGTDIIVVSPNPRELTPVVFIVDFTGTTDNVKCVIYGGLKITGGTADAGSATNTLDLDTSGGSPLATSVLNDDDLIAMFCVIDGGAAQGDIRMITDFDGTTNDRITVANNWSTTTDNTSTYSIYAMSVIQSFLIEADEDPSLLDLNSRSSQIQGYDSLMFAAYQPDGTTDTHNFQVAYRPDGVSAT